jgi:heat shock protein HtpX
MDSLFSTHPNTDNRVAALEEIAREMGQSGGGAQRAEPAARGPWAGSGQAGGGGSGPWG